MDIDEKTRYYKITRTLFQMLRDRGTKKIFENK